MTKRTLFIIIGLLVLLDVSTFIVYWSGTGNQDGKTSLDFGLMPVDTIVENADTIPDVIVEDRFDTLSRQASYVSQEMAVVGGHKKRMTCDIKMKLVWPQSINGSSEFEDLKNSLMRVIVKRSLGSVSELTDSLLLHPQFVTPSSKFSAVAGPLNKGDAGSSSLYYRVFPYVRTRTLLEMVVLIEKNIGGKLQRAMSIVHYDRMRHRVLNLDDIFDLSHTDDIIILVNRGIELLKAQKNNSAMHEITELPVEFLLGSKSVIYYLPDGSISPAGSGIHEVTVSNDDLNEFFTDYYREVLNNDTHFLCYGYLDW